MFISHQDKIPIMNYVVLSKGKNLVAYTRNGTNGKKQIFNANQYSHHSTSVGVEFDHF